MTEKNKLGDWVTPKAEGRGSSRDTRFDFSEFLAPKEGKPMSTKEPAKALWPIVAAWQEWKKINPEGEFSDFLEEADFKKKTMQIENE